MNQKRTIFIVAAFCLFIVMTSADILKKGGRAGNTGSPGENRCNECHGGNPLNSGGLMTIASDVPNNQYTPGQTYTITVTVAKDGFPIFGMGVEALTASNTNAGTFIITNATETQTLTAPNGRVNVVHKLNGGLNLGSKTFTFQWTAPMSGTGAVTFYGSGIAGNNNNNDNGDFVYTATLALTEMVSSISPAFHAENIRLYPNPANDWLNVETDLTNLKSIVVVDMNGRVVADYDADALTSVFVKPLPAGLYFIQAVNKDNEVVATQKFVRK